MSWHAGTPAGSIDDRSPKVVRFPGPGAVSAVLAVLLAVFVRPVIALFGRFPNARWPFRWVDGVAVLMPRPRRVTREPVTLAHCRAELLTPKALAHDGDTHHKAAILYLHGGGFITCGLRSHRRLAADVANAAGQPTLAVEYRQLPQYALADSLDDAVAGFSALISQGYASSDISIVGDSAGGYLAIATALAVVRRGLGRPAAVVALSPMTCIDPEFVGTEGISDPLLTASAVRVLSGKLNRAEPTAPVRRRLLDEDLSELPPTLIQVGTREVLAAGAHELAAHIAAAGVSCELQVWDGQFHVFQAAAALLAPGRAAVAQIGQFVRRADASAYRPG